MINEFKTPKDKIIILLNFCNIITSMINEHSRNRNNIAGADEVYPLVVYAILKGNIRKMKSNINYIKNFRHSTRLESAEDYYFITIYTAIGFVENLKYKNLKISEGEFSSLCSIYEQRAYEALKAPRTVFKRRFILYR
jgi:predicted transcriptional regulator